VREPPTLRRRDFDGESLRQPGADLVLECEKVSEGAVETFCPVLSTCGRHCMSIAVQPDPPAGCSFNPLDEALNLAKQEQRRLFLYFGRQGCPSCDKKNRESSTEPGYVTDGATKKAGKSQARWYAI